MKQGAGLKMLEMKNVAAEVRGEAEGGQLVEEVRLEGAAEEERREDREVLVVVVGAQ